VSSPPYALDIAVALPVKVPAAPIAALISNPNLASLTEFLVLPTVVLAVEPVSV
jgi:hypothetical protein